MIHEEYKPERVDRTYNDIALVKLDRPLKPSFPPPEANIMPICLPDVDTFKDEEKRGGC